MIADARRSEAATLWNGGDELVGDPLVRVMMWRSGGS
jgi:hypothetical protein